MIFQFVNKIGFMGLFLDNEKNMDEWSVDKAVKMSVLLLESCKLFETRK